MNSSSFKPWQTLTKQVVYENPWIEVSHRDVITPTGTDGIYGVVHFKGTAVGVIPISETGETWLVSQTRYPFGERTWEIPEGGVPLSDTPLAGAKRELAEEVGLHAQDWQHLISLQTSNSVTDEVAEIFVAQQLSEVSQQLDATEDIEVKKVSLDNALAMVMAGEIVDAMSVSALLKLKLMPEYAHFFNV